jgi:hypothetical protein
MVKPLDPATLPKLLHTFYLPAVKKKMNDPLANRDKPFYSFFTLLPCPD